jgi:DNA-binding NarL/FixJ family response regulator
MPNIRVLIVDNHSMLRRGLRAACESVDDIEVVGEAENGRQAVDLAQSLTPDVVLMDLNMPVMDGAEATQHILAHNPTIAVVVLSMFEEDEQVLRAIQSGAKGYLLKSKTDDALLIQGIYAVIAGGMLIDPEITARLLSATRGVPARPIVPPPLKPNPDALTPAELELLRLVAQGDENKQIAETLSLSEKTVANRLSLIYEKIQVSNRVQATLYALQHGLAPLPKASSN